MRPKLSHSIPNGYPFHKWKFPATPGKQEEGILMQQTKQDKDKEMNGKDTVKPCTPERQTAPAVKKKKKKWEAISLNAGCGAFDLALMLAGIRAVRGEEEMQEAIGSLGRYRALASKCPFTIREAYEKNENARKTYEANSLTGLRPQESAPEKFSPADLVLGWLPAPKDGLEEAYQELMRCLREAAPKAAAIRVSRALTFPPESGELKRMLINIKKTGYEAPYATVAAQDYGVAEARAEAFIICIRKGIKYSYELPEPTHGESGMLLPFVTMRDAIGHLEDNPGPYYKGSYSPVYMSRNRKKGWDELSHSIQDNGRMMPMHPSGGPMHKASWEGYGRWEFGEGPNRRLSVKEAAAIQSFPAWFRFKGGENQEGNRTITPAYHQIGQSCPPLLAARLLTPIAELADGMASGRIREKRPAEIPCTLTITLADGRTLRDYQAALVAMDNAAFAVRTGSTPAEGARAEAMQKMLEKALQDARVQASWCGRSNTPKAASGSPVRTVKAKNCTVILCGKNTEDRGGKGRQGT